MNSEAGTKRVAIMQPYFFPYIGYYQMVHAVDTFVFYDDVNYIKSGWINRNRILINSQPAYLTVTLQAASPNKLICEIALLDNRQKILRTIEQAYAKAPYFKETIGLVRDVLTRPVQHISELAMYSVTSVMDHLGLVRDYRVSSSDFANTKSLPRADRLIAITGSLGADHYINAIGGQELYEKAYFREQGITLDFLQAGIQDYAQFSRPFHPALSMIDVLMFNDRETVATMLSQYKLI